jgi:hypothetical protein
MLSHDALVGVQQRRCILVHTINMQICLQRIWGTDLHTNFVLAQNWN